MSGDELGPIGETEAAQERNAALLSGYDYSKYVAGITGFSGQDLQRIASVRYRQAVRTRVGPRGSYKAGMTRLANGKLLAAVRSQLRGTEGEALETSWIMRCEDDGETWSEPVQLPGTGEVQPYLTKLADGRILVTYTNYHLPFGIFAMASCDGGKSWDRDQRIQLSVSADLSTGWPVTIELPDGDLITSYASTTYLKEPPDTTTCEVVRWRLSG